MKKLIVSPVLMLLREGGHHVVLIYSSNAHLEYVVLQKKKCEPPRFICNCLCSLCDKKRGTTLLKKSCWQWSALSLSFVLILVVLTTMERRTISHPERFQCQGDRKLTYTSAVLFDGAQLSSCPSMMTVAFCPRKNVVPLDIYTSNKNENYSKLNTLVGCIAL